MAQADETDPRGLIREAFRIPGISIEECRSIFLDWALSLPDGVDSERGVKRLVSRHQAEPKDHPMRQVLDEALAAPAATGRRGGHSGRVS